MPVEGLHGAICIYVDGRAQFMDELELLSDSEQDHALDVYCDVLGLNQICIGPGYALRYDHHDQPPIDWRVQDPLPLLRKLRARGLHITIVMLPDCAPFYVDGRWQRDLIETNLGDVYRRIAAEGLADSIRLEWETQELNESYCWATRWARGIFGADLGIFFHNWVSHPNPGLSSEPIGDRQMWENILSAGATGMDLQTCTPYSQTSPLNPLPTAMFDLWDMRRRATGTNGSPWGAPLLTLKGVPMVVRWAEYAAYDIKHSTLPWSVACNWGRQGMAVAGPGDDTALDGWSA